MLSIYRVIINNFNPRDQSYPEITWCYSSVAIQLIMPLTYSLLQLAIEIFMSPRSVGSNFIGMVR